MSLYAVFRRSDGSWKSPGVAQSLSRLAPRLAARDLVAFANVRASEIVLSASKAAAVVSARQPHDANAVRYQDRAARLPGAARRLPAARGVVRRRRGRPYGLAAFQKFCS
jgi:hypothetical protein